MGKEAPRGPPEEPGACAPGGMPGRRGVRGAPRIRVKQPMALRTVWPDATRARMTPLVRGLYNDGPLTRYV